jgi:cell division protein ZapE
MSQALLEKYRGLLGRGLIAADGAQALAVEKLQILSNRLSSYTPPLRADFFTFFTRRRGTIPKGLYIFGGVGTGKTTLMDLFYEAIPIEKKRRDHFHEFMAEVHGRLAEARREEKGDPVRLVGKALAAEARLICLDELFVLDIADATILNRLFTALFEMGSVVVVTSNVPPRDLYKDGRNRDLFLPFIDLVEENMELFQLEALRDYRLDHLSKSQLYFTPADRAARAAMDALWNKFTEGKPRKREILKVLGHDILVPCASSGAARFGFPDLFEQPLGAHDYLSLARHYHTIFVDEIPVMGADLRNEARRFITFIDTLYDRRTRLIASAQADPTSLYAAGDGADHFERTASRLIEMRSAAYLSRTGADLRERLTGG